MANSLFKIIEKDITKKNRILQIGITFKENVPDIRNSKAADMAMIFLEKGYNLEIYDPVAIPSEVEENYDLKLNYLHGRYDYIIFAVPHQKLVRNFSKIFFKYIYSSSIVFDIKGVLRNKIFKKNFKYKSL